MIKSRMNLAGQCNMHGEKRNVYTYSFLIGKPERKISLGRPRPRWEDNRNLTELE
jgi:hypothetical protein